MDEDQRALAVLAVRRVARKVARIFIRLDSYPYIAERERGEFRYYRALFLDALAGMERRAEAGELRLPGPGTFPACLPEGRVSLGLYIGSFDPFQMTNLAAVLRFLSEPGTGVSLVLVVPEGARSKAKPRRSEYRYRFDIMAKQLRGVFDPFVCPADLGEGEDTIGIGRRLIAALAGRSVELAHLVGSDILPNMARLIPDDLVWWNAEAAVHNVEFSYRVRALARRGAPDPTPSIEAIRAQGIPVDIDPRPIDLPSSTDFRRGGAFTIVFPTPAVIKHLEVVFRYSLDKPWGESALVPFKPEDFRDI